MNSIQDLIGLQEIDTHLEEIEELLGNLPKKVAALKSEEITLTSDFKQGKERGIETERIIRKLSEIVFEELGGKEVDDEVEQNYFKEKLSNIDRKKID